ncbi:MAG: hypothetical protein EBY21_09065 [Alphaproteobacteria bacterium]|nr:hypothetical protein [Alphaproteobacteria bacterium]
MAQDGARIEIGRRAFSLNAILFIHACFWIVLALIMEGSIRLDVAEGVIGGPEWQISYLRHPPFSTWLTGLTWRFGALRYVALFALGQLLMLSGLLIIGRLLHRSQNAAGFAPAAFAFILLPFATYIPLQVNHNLGVTPFWALTLLMSWLAFETGQKRYWIGFGLAVGLGVWAKYAIFHLVAPLGLLFLIVPVWRAQLRTSGPWIAALVGLAVVLPHLVDSFAKGASTISFAMRAEGGTVLRRMSYMGEFALDALLYNLTIAAILTVLLGWQALRSGLEKFINSLMHSRFDLFVATAAMGPILLIILFVPLGIRPRLLWLTPISMSFVLLWGRIAALALERSTLRNRGFIVPAMACVGSVYVAVRLLAPLMPIPPMYPDIDGRALAQLAQQKWNQSQSGSIPYIVSFGNQRGRQVAGSIAFDLPYRVRVLENNSTQDSPWINLEDVKRRGALVVSPAQLSDDQHVAGQPITALQRLERPLRGGGQDRIGLFMGIVPPASP